MKVIGIQSSPNEDGLTSMLAQAVLEGAKSGGAEIELIHLNKLHIESYNTHNRGEVACQKEGKCMIKDDFEDLRQKVKETDVLVFSTPVYFSDISESAKCFLDRLRRCEVSNRRNLPLRGKLAIGIAAAGGLGGGAVNALRNLENYLRFFNFAIFDLVPVTRKSRKHKLEMLQVAGKRLVKKDFPQTNLVT